MLFEISINLYQSIICVYFLKRCVPVENTVKIADCLCVAACTAFLTLYLFFDIAVTDSINAIIFFVYLRCVSDKRWYVLALWVMVKEVIVVTTVGLMMAACQALTSATHEMLMEAGALRVIFVLSTNLVLFLVFFVFSRIMRKADYPLAVPALLYFLGTNIAVFFSIEMLFSMQVSALWNTDWHIFAAYGAMISCSVLSVLLYHTMTDVVQRENQSQIALKHAQMTRQHQQTLTCLLYTSSPSSQWEAVVEVSLSPRGIVAHLPATAGSTGCVDRSGLCHRRAAPFAALPRGGSYL